MYAHYKCGYIVRKKIIRNVFENISALRVLILLVKALFFSFSGDSNFCQGSGFYLMEGKGNGF